MDTTTFLAALKIMSIGMTGIFVFMLLFGVIIFALHKIFPFKKEPESEEKYKELTNASSFTLKPEVADIQLPVYFLLYSNSITSHYFLA